MIVIAVLLGALAGGALSGFFGAVAGSFLGYGTWSIFSLRKRVSLLEEELRALSSEAETRTFRTPAASGSAATAPDAVPRTAQESVPHISPEKKETTTYPLPSDTEAVPRWTPEWTSSATTVPPPPLTDQPVSPGDLSPGQEFMKTLKDLITGGSL
ncbi:MAG TPA: hypothetical protein PK036_17885, partial [Geobacteraceae bacterium]|nr:hypothetical protein [Geobacteraceae bacterium]